MIKPYPYINKIIFSEYLIQKKIGKGSFGTVYQGIIVTTSQKIAVKLEKRVKDEPGLLETEACRLYLMQGEGIPKIVCYGNNQTHNILVQELLGNSLEQLFNINGRKFTLKTVCSIGIEMIKRIRFVHSKYHIHRDIKPDNFMTGIEKDDNKIYIIDFGLAKKYYSISKNRHIKFHTGKNLIGTARYCGRNAHRGYEQGRRDDIESIGYVLIYFLNGILPWQGLKTMKGEQQFEKIAEKKYNTTFEELTKGHPEEFLLYFKHCDSLQFEDEPNYDYLISLFKNVINKYCIDCLYDYDWKKNTIPDLSAIKDKEDNNNNIKDTSLIVHNNISAIESRGEGKDEDKENDIKLKKVVFIGEDKNKNIHSNINNTKENGFNYKDLKKNRSSKLIYQNNLMKDNYNVNNEIIDINDKNIRKNNNIFILNNEITPKIQNINININYSNNLKPLTKEDNIFNQTDININKDIRNDIINTTINNGSDKKLNNYHKNIMNKKNIKKEFFFSYDQNMDDMIKSNKNALKNLNINYEEINKIQKNKLSRFLKPKKLENLFTEDDVKSEDINDTCNKDDYKNENNIDKTNISITNSKNVSNEGKIKKPNNNIKIINNNKNIYGHELEHEHEHEYEHHHNHEHHHKKKKVHHRNHHKNKSMENLKDIKMNIENDNNNNRNNIKSIINSNIIISNNDKNEDKIKSNSTKEINQGINYDKKNISDEKIIIDEDNDQYELKKKKRSRVKSVETKLRKNNLGCYCSIY